MLYFFRFVPIRSAHRVLGNCGAIAASAALLFALGCGGNGKLAGSQTTSPTASPGAASNSVTFSNVQSSYWNWQGFGQIAPTYADCPAPCPQSTWSQSFGVSTPSKSGNATEFQLNPNLPEADVLFTTTLVGQSSPFKADADHSLLPTLHHFTYDADVYVQDPSIITALEFDISLWMDGAAGMTFGTQCDYLGDGDWDVWNNAPGVWTDTGRACKLSAGWHHVTLQFKRESDDSTTYEAIVLDGTTYSLNWSFPPTVTPDGWWGLAANYQMDSDQDGEPITTYLDNLSITYQP